MTPRYHLTVVYYWQLQLLIRNIIKLNTGDFYDFDLEYALIHYLTSK